MAKHRTFNADKFLDKFVGSEQLIRDFVAIWAGGLDIDASGLDIPTFKKWLVEGGGDARDELLEALYQVYDLCTERGHEDLLAACNEFDYDPDPDHVLPVECLSLKVRTESEEAFVFAYDRYNLWRAERFTIYRGLEAKPITDLDSASKEFKRRLGEEFWDHKKSDRVLVRHYAEGPYVNFIVYHDKRVKATLILKGSTSRLKVQPTIFRPAQQDFISYNRETGQVEIEAGFENEEAKLRRCFAECCFGNPDFFDGPHAADRINLSVLASPDFMFPTVEGGSVALVELHFKLNQKHGPTFVIRSKDVFETLELNGLRRKLDGDLINKAVLKVIFPDDQRGKRVEVSGSNKIKFKRATHAEDIFRLLADCGILLDESDEDTAELRAASAAFFGSPDRSTS